MYICICKGITEKMMVDQLKASDRIEKKEIFKNLGIGSSCGICVLECQELFEDSPALNDAQNPKTK